MPVAPLPVPLPPRVRELPARQAAVALEALEAPAPVQALLLPELEALRQPERFQ